MTETAGSWFHYSRVSATPNGGSRFEDVAVQLTEQRVAAGMPPMLVGGLGAASSVTYLRSEAFDSEPHPAPRTQWVIMLRGAIEVTTSDEESRRFGAGDLLLLTDTEGAGHTTQAVGEPPHEGLFVALPE